MTAGAFAAGALGATSKHAAAKQGPAEQKQNSTTDEQELYKQRDELVRMEAQLDKAARGTQAEKKQFLEEYQSHLRRFLELKEKTGIDPYNPPLK